MKFKDLPIGATFEFDHRMLMSWSGAVGPWQKRTPRTYVHADQHSTQHFRVGTINVRIVQVHREAK